MHAQHFRPLTVNKIPSRTLTIIITLISIYIALQLIADITVFKMVTLFGITLPAGSLLYAITFTWRDLMHKKLGLRWSRTIIVLAAVCNIMMALWFVICINLPSASWWTQQAPFALVLGIIPRVTVASLISEVLSELVDTEIYSRVEKRFTGKMQFMRVILSNAVSAPMDAIVFGVLAFWGTMTAGELWTIVWGGMIFKWIIGYLVLPLVYITKDRRLELVEDPNATGF